MADYRIYPVSSKEAENKSYFLDANVWIYVIDRSTKPSHKPYIDFFEKIIAANQTYEVGKEQYIKAGNKIKPGYFDDTDKPIIILTPLLVSEMFNVLIRKRFDEWKDANSKPTADFKRDFRGTEDYVNAFKLLTTELFNYRTSYKIISDDNNVIDVEHIFKDNNYSMDFNDQCYYYTCYQNNFIMVTNDGDFKVEYVNIYTELSSLLSISTI